MNMCIMLAINPPHVGRILEGIKRVEWRKSPLPVGRRTFLYETKNGGGCGMVVGEVVIKWVTPFNIYTNYSCFFDRYIYLGCVPKEELKRYAGKKPVLYAHDLIHVKKYRKPLPISEFGLKRAPLSWCYCIDPLERPDLPDWDLHPKF